MDAHKYRIGQSVSYRSPGADAPQGDYVIIARLPQRDDGEFEYQIRNLYEQHERVAQESELRNGTQARPDRSGLEVWQARCHCVRGSMGGSDGLV